MHTIAPTELVKWLRAAGEPSRLRLLALCAEGALSVSDLSQALKQSEPRVSRHLKILSEAGLIERLRQGQWVHYRVSAAAEAASFVRGLLAQVDRRDALLVRDRAAAHAGALAHASGAESRLGRALAELLRAAGLREAEGPVLLIGVDHPELLEAAAGAGQACTALAHSRRAAQGARAHAERRALSCRILQARDAAGPNQEDFARAGSGFGLVLLDHPAAGAALPRLLAQARTALAPGGQLWMFEGYDALENAGARVVEHPLARLRRLLSEAGLECERISPIEADGAHVLAALARPSAAGTARAQHGGSTR
jgi:ArsR family transcriptional regulator